MINTDAKWVLAPAYDLLNVLIVNPGDKEELALTIEGKKKKLSRANFERLGKVLELNGKQIEGVFKRLINNKPLAIKWVDNSFLSDDFKEKYKILLEEKYLVLSH